MAENKKSFLLYCDLIHTVQKLNDEQAGKLFKHVLEYVNDLNPATEDIITDLCFEPIKQNLKRDLRKYESTCEKRSEAGKKSAELRAAKSNERSTVVNENVRNSTVSVNVNDNVNVINNNIDSRKLKFADTLKPFIDIYGKDLIKDFYGYWTEPNKSNTKFKKELEKTWDTKRRLENWAKNDKTFYKPKQEIKKGLGI